MKKSDMIKLIAPWGSPEIIDRKFDGSLLEWAEELLAMLEKTGMKPPSVSEEDRQAILSVYYGGYSFNQWDEDLAQDEKVKEARQKRREATERRSEQAKQRREEREKK